MSQKFVSINKLKDQHVVLFGGTTGIGMAVAAAALEHGAYIFVASSQQKNVDAAIKHLKTSYPGEEFQARICGAVCDLGTMDTVEANLERVFETVTQKGKQLVDHVVFTAGNLRMIPLENGTAESIVEAGIIRFIAPLLIGKMARKYMRISNKSSITVTGGSMSRRPEDKWSILASYASAVEGLRFGMAIELAPIRVNAVSPGAVQTPLLANMPEADLARWKRQLLTGELGWAEDTAEAYVYSMKDRSATGALIDTSDGRLFS